jgi:hypothetical protein
VDGDAAFLKYLEKSSADAKDELRRLLARRYSAEDLHCARQDVLLLCSGLVAHGRIVIKALLPLPEGLDPEREPERFRQWMYSHGAALQWDAARDRYVLRSRAR